MCVCLRRGLAKVSEAGKAAPAAVAAAAAAASNFTAAAANQTDVVARVQVCLVLRYVTAATGLVSEYRIIVCASMRSRLCDGSELA